MYRLLLFGIITGCVLLLAVTQSMATYFLP